METRSRDAARTVVVSGVPDLLPPGRMKDKLTVHFQSRRRSHGGDVGEVAFPTDMEGVAVVTFDRAEDAARVVRKEQQILTDDRFSQDVPLTVFPFSGDVNLYVSRATLHLHVFGSDLEPLIQSLRSTHRSIRFQPLLHRRTVSIEGPFAAVRALREDVVLRAPREDGGLRALTEDVGLWTLREDMGLGAPREDVGLRAAASAFTAAGGPREEAVSSADAVWEETLGPSGSRGRRTKQAKVHNNKETHAGTTTPPVLVLAERTSDDTSQRRTGADRGENHQGSRRNLKEPDQSSSDAKLLRTRLDDRTRMSPSSESLRVDAHTLRYIQRFDRKELDRCLDGLEAAVQYLQGTGLAQMLLTQKQTSATPAPSRLRRAAKNLRALEERWKSTLRVRTIPYDEQRRPGRRTLVQVCGDVNLLFHDVLCVFEDSRLTVVGPSASSRSFCRRVKDGLNSQE